MFSVTKTYGHDLGISAAFRQWRAESHCRFIHGYALAFAFVFQAQQLDKNGWVLDFGALKPLKERLLAQFDHKTLVAEDDPQFERLKQAHMSGLVDLRIMDRVGCEAFAKWAHGAATVVLEGIGESWRVRCAVVEVSEHGANSATFTAV